jgi:hypothetical protein
MDPILALLLALSITGLLCFWGLALAWLLDRPIYPAFVISVLLIAYIIWKGKAA